MTSVRLQAVLAVAIFAGAAGAQAVAVSEKTGSVARAEDIPITTASASARTHFAAGQRLLDVGRPREAREQFRLAVEQDPSFAYGYLNLAAAAASAPEFKENLDRAAANLTGKSDAERILVDINRTFLDNNAERRIELAQKLVSVHPSSPRAWVTLGNAQGALNRHELAREAYNRAIALDPKMFLAQTALGFSYLFSEPRDLAKAKWHMEQAIAADPKEAKGYEQLGDVYRALNQLEQAREAYSKAVDKDAKLAVAVLKKGHINSFLGNYAEARAAYDAAIADGKEVEKPTYGVFRAYASVHAGQPKAAIEELTAVARSAEKTVPAKQVNGAKAFALVSAVQIALHNDLLDEAERVLAVYAPVVRADAKAVNDASNSRLTEAAILAWESQLAARRGDFAKALAKAKEHKSLIENDQNPRRFETYHSLLGLIELRKKAFAEAIPHYRQADLTDVYQKYHLALALEGAGQSAEARKIFRDVASWNFNSVGFALTRRDAMKRGTSAN
ncbi:MAG TPA: tetratricopeptide repeat protein [Gemmatimonadaceae bacterium]|nr:tetratricopeptide repeat protein [Gemmatimonadaceae bacterium]